MTVRFYTQHLSRKSVSLTLPSCFFVLAFNGLFFSRERVDATPRIFRMRPDRQIGGMGLSRAPLSRFPPISRPFFFECLRRIVTLSPIRAALSGRSVRIKDRLFFPFLSMSKGFSPLIHGYQAPPHRISTPFRDKRTVPVEADAVPFVVLHKFSSPC